MSWNDTKTPLDDRLIFWITSKIANRLAGSVTITIREGSVMRISLSSYDEESHQEWESVQNQ